VGVALSQHKASGGGGAAMEFAVDASFCEAGAYTRSDFSST